MDASLQDLVSDPAASPVLGLMREGRWRKARDAAKELCKRDRGRYLVLLVEANVGLVRELIGKGLAKDAATVVAYLESVAPPATVAALREELTRPPSPDAGKSVPAPGAALAWVTALRADRELAADKPVTPAEQADIDSLVSDSYLPVVPPDDERERRVAAELVAVRAACAATGDGRWEEAQAALRGVPARSVFRHWRMFLRGVRGVFQDQPEMARQCFAGLPAHGALARAARAFAPKLAPTGPAAPPTARVALQLAMTGQPAAWTAPIATAASAWKSGKRAQALLDLLAGMKGVFPATDPGLPAVLTDAMLPFCDRMTPADGADADQLMRKWDPWEERGLRTAPGPALAAIRPICLAEADTMSTPELQASWRSVIDLWNRLQGPTPLRDSMLWQWLGENLVKIEAEEGSGMAYGFGFRQHKKDFTRARAALEKAVEFDPGNEAAWLSLLGLLDLQKDHKTRNKLLDELAKRFPENKTILVRTGTLALERKAFDKGLAVLRKALALDPLDRHTRGMIVVALLRQLREFRRKGRHQAPLWEELEPLLDDRAAHGQLGLARWLARLRRALLDPDEAAAATAAAAAARLAPSVAERLFAERLLASVEGLAIRPDWNREWTEVKRSGGHPWSELQGCLETGAFFSQAKEWSRDAAGRCQMLAMELCKAVARDAVEDDPDGLLTFLDQARPLFDQRTQAGDCGITMCLEQLDFILNRSIGGQAETDPRLRLAGLLIDEFHAGRSFTAAPPLFKALERLEADAGAMNMPGVVARVRALRERWQRILDQRRLDFDDPWDADDDSDDADDDDEGPSDDIIGRFLHLLRLGIEQGDRMVRDLAVSTLLRIGVSQQDIDREIAAGEAAARKLAPKPAAKPRKAKPLPPPNPNQSDLPF